MRVKNQEYIDSLLKKCGLNSIIDVVIFFEFYKTWLKKEHYKKAYDLFRGAFTEQMSLFYDCEIDDEGYANLIGNYKRGASKQLTDKMKDNIKLLGEQFL